jgi:hypothetical protein
MNVSQSLPNSPRGDFTSGSSSSYAPPNNNYFAQQYALANHNSSNAESLSFTVLQNPSLQAPVATNSSSNHVYKSDYSPMYSNNPYAADFASSDNRNVVSGSHNSSRINPQQQQQQHYVPSLSSSSSSVAVAVSLNPVPVCSHENFQWLANGHEDEGHDVDILFDVS